MSRSFDKKGGTGWVRALLVFCFVTSLGVINTASSFANNFHIAMLEAFFFFSVCVLWRVKLSAHEGYKDITGIFFGVVVCVLLANALAAYDGVALADWRRVFELLAHLALFVAIFLLLVRSPEVLSSVLWGVGLSVVVVLSFIVQAWLSSGDPYRYPWVSSPPLFTHIRNLGGFFCAASIVLGFAFFHFSGARRFVFLGLYMLALAILLWSGGRGAIAAFICGFALLLLRYPCRACWRSWGGLALVTIFALFLAALFDVGNRSMGWLNMFSRTLGAQSLDQVSSSRLYIWSSLLESIVERPWFGWGARLFGR